MRFANAIARRRSSTRVALRGGFLALVLELASWAPEMIGQTHGGCALVHELVCTARRVMPRIVAALHLSGNPFLADTLLKDWSDKHSERKHASQPLLPPPPRKRSVAVPSCYEAGVCLHGGARARVLKFKRWLEMCLTASAKWLGLRAKLGQCRIVVRLRRVGGPPDDGGAEKSFGEGQRVLFEQLVPVGLMYWLAYKPTFRSCVKEMTEPPDIIGHVHRKCQHHYLGVFDIAEEFGASMARGGVGTQGVARSAPTSAQLRQSLHNT